MPLNRNALIRYRTIDNCLKNRQRRWTLEDLIDACSEALYEYEGIDKGVSRRSIQMDIQFMRSDKLGYNAPIIVLEKKYYTYEDPEYSIANIPLTDQDLGKLSEVVEILKQFKGFSHFQDLSGMVQRLENKIFAARTNSEPVIDFEKNENLKGLEHIETLYQAIVKKCAVELCYQSFRARSASAFTFHPYYLKEYRNRWFVLGVTKRKSPILTLALDRIISISECDKVYLPKGGDFSLPAFFKDVVGVTVNAEGRTERVLLFADSETAPYILTKPIHHSQRAEETLSNGMVFSLHVQLNFELEREILGFGDHVRVLAPERLKRRIKESLTHALDQYQYELSENALHGALQKLSYKGFMILHHVFSKKAVNQIKLRIDQYFKIRHAENAHAIRDLFGEIPELRSLVFNANLLHILKKIDSRLFLSKAVFFDKTPNANWYVTWHQDITISVKDRVETSGFTSWTTKSGAHHVCPPEDILRDTIIIRVHLDDANEANGALRVLPGSHRKKLGDEEIKLIRQNSIPYLCDVEACGIHIMKPLLLHASSKATRQKHRRVIHLEFNTMNLPNGLEWAERVEMQGI
jgi:predicted DNA-binding transcriptional regulator YafY